MLEQARFSLARAGVEQMAVSTGPEARRQSAPWAAAGVAAVLSVPAAAASFVLQYAICANATFSVSSVLAAMVGTHVLIGIGEALITLFAVGAVLASRSDLVYGYTGEKASLEIRNAS